MRRALIILAIVIVLGGAGAAAYFYFATRSPGVTVTPGGTTLPTAGSTTGTPTSQPTATTTVLAHTGGALPRLVQISKGPVVSGEAVTDVADDVSVTYIERQSGNVFRYLARAGTITRTSNRTIPGIQEAYWLPNATAAFVRYLSGDAFTTINTYALPADGSNGFFLAQNLSGIAVSSTTVLTVASGVNGSIVSSEHPDGSKLATLFSTPLSALRMSFAGKSSYLAFTKPSATLKGDAFVVDGAGHFSRIAGPLNGLVALASPSGKWVVVSYMQNNSFKMRLVNTATNESIPLPVATIADKCVWALDDSVVYCAVPIDPSANYAYPDDWYQSAVSFSDRIWKINVAGRFAQLVLDFSKESGSALDGKALAIDPANTTLVFINKTDGSLWAYQL